jgi:hypothetical protein
MRVKIVHLLVEGLGNAVNCRAIGYAENKTLSVSPNTPQKITEIVT